MSETLQDKEDALEDSSIPEAEQASGFSVASQLSWLFWTALVLAVVLVMAKFHVEINQIKAGQREQYSQVPTTSRNDGLIQSLVEQQKSLTMQLKLLVSKQQSLTEDMKNFQGDLDTLRSQEKNPGQLYTMTEIDFLIEKANFKLNYENDIAGALAILKLISEKADKPELASLKGEINTLIIKLEPYTQINLDNLLDSLQQLESVLLATPIRLTMTGSHAHPGDIAEKVAKTWGDKLWDHLKEIVVVQRIDRPIKPIINEHEEALVHNQMRLKVQQAEMALLVHDFARFQTIIGQLKQFVSDFIDFNQSSHLALEKQFDELLSMKFPERYPNIKGLHRVLADQKLKRG